MSCAMAGPKPGTSQEAGKTLCKGSTLEFIQLQGNIGELSISFSFSDWAQSGTKASLVPLVRLFWQRTPDSLGRIVPSGSKSPRRRWKAGWRKSAPAMTPFTAMQPPLANTDSGPISQNLGDKMWQADREPTQESEMLLGHCTVITSRII